MRSVAKTILKKLEDLQVRKQDDKDTSLRRTLAFYDGVDSTIEEVKALLNETRPSS